MRWDESEGEFDVFEDELSADERQKAVDAYLEFAFSKIGDSYEFNDCPAIIFELWSNSRLLVFDSPDGANLNRNERVYTQLIQQDYTRYTEDYIDTVCEKHGVDSKNFEEAELFLETLTWNACKLSLTSGKASKMIMQFNSPPILIWVGEGDDSLAHDIVSGKRIEMEGKPITDELKQICHCEFCTQLRE